MHECSAPCMHAVDDMMGHVYGALLVAVLVVR